MESDEEPTITTDTTTPSNGATETRPKVEDENSDAIGSAVVARVPAFFGVRYFTHFPGHTLAVTGNHPDLGSWGGLTEDEYWTGTMRLPSMSQVERKFVVVGEGGGGPTLGWV